MALPSPLKQFAASFSLIRPFSLTALSQQVLCEVPQLKCVIRTIAYTFR